jgi:drug/metabolite transporter (DMT)-like permease
VTTRRHDLIGPALAASAGILLAIVVITGKPALGGGVPFTLLAFRFAGTAVILAVVALATGQGLRPASGEGRGMLAAGFLGYGVESALFFSALNHGTAAAVALLFYTYPVYTMLVALATKRMPSNRSLWLALAAAMLGVSILVAGGGTLALDRIGVILALTCALGYTLYMTVTDRVLQRSHPITGAIFLASGAAAMNLALALVSGSFEFPAGWDEWRPIAIMALATATAFVCVLGAIKRIGAVRTSIIAVSEPLAVTLLGALVLEEPLTVWIAIGGVFILTAGVIATLARGPTRVVEPDV